MIYKNNLKKEVIMPGLNHKGPMGNGPMTGRKMGKCTNFGAGKKSSTEETERENSTMTSKGRGMGRGLGRGQGGQGMGMGRKNRNCNGN
jgi:hypothetical protein